MKQMFREQHTRRQLLRFSRVPALILSGEATTQNAAYHNHPMTHCAWAEHVLPLTVTTEHQEQFQRYGHVMLPQLIDGRTVKLLNDRLEAVLQDCFDLGQAPDKMPKGRNAWSCGKRTLQIVNIRKADAAFRRVIMSPELGKFIASLAGWPGTRVASDQVWAKPPTGGPLVFHRDSAYFDFVPSDVITLWLALDDMTPDVGPLEYVHGSHLWGEGRIGSANQFFDRDRFGLMLQAAKSEGLGLEDLTISMVKCNAGGAGVHNGRTWHGSGPNTSRSKPRRGLGIHFVPSNVTFKDAPLGNMWRKFRDEDGVVDEKAFQQEFPVTFQFSSAATDHI